MSNLYDATFHKNIQSDEIPQAKRIAEYVHLHVKPSNIIDFGCSTGLYLQEIKQKMPPNTDLVGYEFSEDAIKHAVFDNIKQVDLTHPLVIQKKEGKTLGICLEVLEHIDDQYWKPVLTNITKLCDVIIFSAAHPGQGGTGHINCRPKIDWIRRFHSLGWVVDHDYSTHFIEYMKSGYHMGWLRMNVIVLVQA